MGPSIWQIIIVLLIVLFIFGPKRIPGLGKSLGEAIKNFRKGLTDGKEDEEESAKEIKDAEVKDAPAPSAAAGEAEAEQLKKESPPAGEGAASASRKEGKEPQKTPAD